MIDDNKIIEIVDSNKVNKMVKNVFKSKKLKNKKFENLKHLQNIEATKKPIFLIFGARKTFNHL